MSIEFDSIEYYHPGMSVYEELFADFHYDMGLFLEDHDHQFSQFNVFDAFWLGEAYSNYSYCNVYDTLCADLFDSLVIEIDVSEVMNDTAYISGNSLGYALMNFESALSSLTDGQSAKYIDFKVSSLSESAIAINAFIFYPSGTASMADPPPSNNYYVHFSSNDNRKACYPGLCYQANTYPPHAAYVEFIRRMNPCWFDEVPSEELCEQAPVLITNVGFRAFDKTYPQYSGYFWSGYPYDCLGGNYMNSLMGFGMAIWNDVAYTPQNPHPNNPNIRNVWIYWGYKSYPAPSSTGQTHYLMIVNSIVSPDPLED